MEDKESSKVIDGTLIPSHLFDDCAGDPDRV